MGEAKNLPSLLSTSLPVSLIKLGVLANQDGDGDESFTKQKV